MLTPKQIAIAIAEAIAETRQPLIEGHAYARLMGQCSLDTFNQACDALVDSKLVTRSGHVLTGTDELFSLIKKAS